MRRNLTRWRREFCWDRNSVGELWGGVFGEWLSGEKMRERWQNVPIVPKYKKRLEKGMGLWEFRV